MVQKHVVRQEAERAAKPDPGKTAADHDSQGSSSGSHLVDRSHEMYSFAVAVMVGIHVAVSCNDFLMDAVGDALGGAQAAPGAAKEDFNSSFPHLCVEPSLATCVRQFVVPHEGCRYSPR